MTSFELWKAERSASAQEAQGDLALVGMYEIRDNTMLTGIPGKWSPISADQPGLVVEAAAEDQLMLNGELLVGRIELEADVTILHMNDHMTITATYQPGSLHLLAVWDARSEAIQQFQGIEVYEYEPSMILKGQFVADDETKTFDFEHTSDVDHRARTHESPGVITFSYEGQAFTMRPFVSGDALILVFRDTTSGKDTYGMGRMLVVKPAQDGNTELDFNHAFLPPCAFSPYFNCPMPPASNRLPFAVVAGEKKLINS